MNAMSMDPWTHLVLFHENYLKTIKQSLRSGSHPLQQLARRDAETNGRLSEPKNIIEGIQLTRNHIDPNETVQGKHYKMLTSNKLTLACVVPDNCFKTEDGSVVLLRNIVHFEDNDPTWAAISDTE